jgi:hypothetical protein
MTEELQDVWLLFGLNMAQDFNHYHQETMPEDFENVWDVDELLYFCIAFVLWAAKTKFINMQRIELKNRADLYRMNLALTLDAYDETHKGSEGTFDYDDYLVRELEYVTLFDKGSRSLLRVVSLSALKPACESMVSHTCKRYVFSQKELLKFRTPE